MNATCPATLAVMPAGGTTQPLRSTSAPDSPLQRYLRDPGGALHPGVEHVEAWATGPGLVIAPVLLAVLVAALLARAWWWRRCQQRLGCDARLVTVLPPPDVDPAGAVALWANLVGLLRPAWRRRVSGQPHVGFEYRFTSDASHIRLWIPGLVPPGMVERAVEAAWPGAHTTTTHLTDTGPDVSAAGPVAVGGTLRLGRPEALPIRTRFDADPLRALFGAPIGLEPGEEAVVQVLARPVTGRRITRARRAATRLHTGRSARPAGRLLDLLTPHATPPRRPHTTAAPAGLDRVTALGHGAQDRSVAGKLAGPQFETVIRYAVTAPTPPELVRGGLAATRDRLRGRAHAIASAFAGYSEHNHYARRRLTHPREVIGARRSPAVGTCCPCRNSPRWRTCPPTSPSSASNPPAPGQCHRRPASPPPHPATPRQ